MKRLVIFMMIVSVDTSISLGQSKDIVTEAKASKAEMLDARGKKITVINFEDAVIEGQAKTPDGFVLQSKEVSKFKSIIELRRDFRLQMNASVMAGTMVFSATP